MWTDQRQMQDYPTPRALETAELPALIKEFVTAARNAREAGFDGVELHAANGYLLNQFLASNCNLRTDGYGTSVNGRIRFVAEVVAAVAAAIGAEGGDHMLGGDRRGADEAPSQAGHGRTPE